jgi:ATP-dependent DNA ligase
MQASLVKKPFDSPDWIFETKLDGCRAIAVIDSAGKAQIVGIKIVAESAFDGIKT